MTDPHLLPTLRAFAEVPLDNDPDDPLVDATANLAARAAAEIERLLAEQRGLVTSARDLLAATRPMAVTDGISEAWLAMAETCLRATVWRSGR